MSNKNVIMTGFHFPPSALSSGHLRMLGFARYLPESGWQPVVLSATKCAYQPIDLSSVRSIPEACHVHRAFALDAKRHLGLLGRYPSILARPDRWASWWPAAVALGLQLISHYRAQAIWSTYPIMTSHCIAYTLSRMTGIPWIADFRDPVADSVAGSDPKTVKSQMNWERRVISRAERTVFTAHGAMRSCAERYPEDYDKGRFEVIENGYDEQAFVGLPEPSPPIGRPVVLLHSGVLYSDGRNPVPFFSALARLKTAGTIGPESLRVVLRASGSEETYTRDIRRMGLEEIVILAPLVSNHDALMEQANADGLLLFQGARFDRQIPAKLYEYLRIGRPVFALVGEQGDTAALLRDAGGAELVPLDDIAAIEARLPQFLGALRESHPPQRRPDAVARFSRRAGAASLAGLLDRVARVGKTE